MNSILKHLRIGTALVAMAIAFGALQNPGALAQTAAAVSTTAALPETTIRAVQQALNNQGVAVKTDGVLDDETRAAIRKYQSLHHLPVTGEPDKATLAKLGVAASQQPAAAQPQSPPPTAGQGQQGGMMMNCPMMEGQMQDMMKMMAGMMKMMMTMQGQMQPGQTQPDQTPHQMPPGAK